ncbi:MAG: class I SAM-dependent methyltransferase [Candidatus Omnitrophica bacterium]|nr:class I SAM-dependent methyltransferase [Candidatus Omnitrophota bacterium]
MDYISRDSCRICFSKDLVSFLDFGKMPLAGGFIRPEDVSAEKLYPLTTAFCRHCKEVQILETVPADVLFKDYRYVSSTTTTLSRHFASYAKSMTERFLNHDSLVVEFGCNDGVLLKPFVDLGVRAVGVEPATNIAKLAQRKGCFVINDFFNLNTAANIQRQHGRASLICANNVFAHIGDIHEPMKAIVSLLEPQGVFVFEVHYLLSLLESCQFDMIYHEHMLHHSLMALSYLLGLYEMEIFDVKRISIHAGSIRVYAQKKATGRHPIAGDVLLAMAQEQQRGLDREETFLTFGKEVYQKRDGLVQLIDSLLQKGKRIVGYGASGRATVHLNFCKLGAEKIPYVTDESSERRGRLIPGMHNPIVSPEQLRQEQPDFALLFAYNFFEEVMKKEQAFIRKGGRFIVPLPESRVVDPVFFSEAA